MSPNPDVLKVRTRGVYLRRGIVRYHERGKTNMKRVRVEEMDGGMMFVDGRLEMMAIQENATQV